MAHFVKIKQSCKSRRGRRLLPAPPRRSPPFPSVLGRLVPASVAVVFAVSAATADASAGDPPSTPGKYVTYFLNFSAPPTYTYSLAARVHLHLLLGDLLVGHLQVDVGVG